MVNKWSKMAFNGVLMIIRPLYCGWMPYSFSHHSPASASRRGTAAVFGTWRAAAPRLCGTARSSWP